MIPAMTSAKAADRRRNILGGVGATSSQDRDAAEDGVVGLKRSRTGGRLEYRANAYVTRSDVRGERSLSLSEQLCKRSSVSDQDPSFEGLDNSTGHTAEVKICPAVLCTEHANRPICGIYTFSQL